MVDTIIPNYRGHSLSKNNECYCYSLYIPDLLYMMIYYVFSTMFDSFIFTKNEYKVAYPQLFLSKKCFINASISIIIIMKIRKYFINTKSINEQQIIDFSAVLLIQNVNHGKLFLTLIRKYD